MCGIVGAAGDIPLLFANNTFKDFLDVCQVRGRDSTGVVKVDKDGKSYDWIKSIGPPVYLYDGRAYEQRIERGQAPSVLIGHCRARTVGEVSTRNAHPFDFPEKGICGVHNGTLRNHWNLDGYKVGLVDSEILYAHLAENGPEKTFTEIDGAYACVWWNQEEGTLNFIRNKERPLWFCWSKNTRMMFWASECWMFAAIERKMDLWDGGEDKKKYFMIPEDTLWSFKIDASAKGDDKTITMRPAKTLAYVPPKKPSVITHHGSHGGSRYDSRWQYDAATNTHRRSGGEVPNPFLERIKKKYLGWDKLSIQMKQAIIKRERLNDPIDDLYDLTTESPTSTDISSVDFLTISAKQSDSKTEQNCLEKPKKPLLCLPDKSSTNSPTKSNVVQLDGYKNSHTSPNSRQQMLQIKSGVSFRIVAGIEYITDNKSKKEYVCDEFLHNTNSTCVFCKTQIPEIGDVGEILSESSFICKTCISEPKQVLM